MTRALYLHGFASSPHSSKASFLAARLTEAGVACQTPDLNQPDFSTLTVTRMLGQVTALIDAEPSPATLVGSSLGGFLAVQAALARPAAVDRLVLLAPALDFSGNRVRDLGDRGIDEWKATGELNVFHYAYGRICPVHYELYADILTYDAMHARLPMPVQVFQGRWDTSVDPATVEQWAAARPNVELHLVDDDHQLKATLDYIWMEMRRFLRI